MDTTSADMLAELLGELRQRDIDLYLVRVMWPVRRLLRRSGLMDELGEDHLWHSISQGVREARHAHGLKHLPAPTGAADVPAEEMLGEETAEEHIVARSTAAPVRRSGTGDSARLKPHRAGPAFSHGPCAKIRRVTTPWGPGAASSRDPRSQRGPVHDGQGSVPAQRSVSACPRSAMPIIGPIDPARSPRGQQPPNVSEASAVGRGPNRASIGQPTPPATHPRRPRTHRPTPRTLARRRLPRTPRRTRPQLTDVNIRADVERAHRRYAGLVRSRCRRRTPTPRTETQQQTVADAWRTRQIGVPRDAAEVLLDMPARHAEPRHHNHRCHPAG